MSEDGVFNTGLGLLFAAAVLGCSPLFPLGIVALAGGLACIWKATSS